MVAGELSDADVMRIRRAVDELNDIERDADAEEGVWDVLDGMMTMMRYADLADVVYKGREMWTIFMADVPEVTHITRSYDGIDPPENGKWKDHPLRKGDNHGFFSFDLKENGSPDRQSILRNDANGWFVLTPEAVAEFDEYVAKRRAVAALRRAKEKAARESHARQHRKLSAELLSQATGEVRRGTAFPQRASPSTPRWLSWVGLVAIGSAITFALVKK